MLGEEIGRGGKGNPRAYGIIPYSETKIEGKFHGYNKMIPKYRISKDVETALV